MTVLCNVSIDADSETLDLPIAVVPRIGENVSIAVTGDARVFRVTRVQHNVDAASAPNRVSVDIEVTINIL